MSALGLPGSLFEKFCHSARSNVPVPDDVHHVRGCEWRGGLADRRQNVFIEMLTKDRNGDPFITDNSHGKMLKTDKQLNIMRCLQCDGEPNRKALSDGGEFLVADCSKNG